MQSSQIEILPYTGSGELRVALFASHSRGLAMLQEALRLQDRMRGQFRVVGIATDDPANDFVHPDKRIWQYPTNVDLVGAIKSLAEDAGIPVHTGRVKGEGFEKTFVEWRPHMCFMGIFGQKIPTDIWSIVPDGFYNFHTCAHDAWPNHAGPAPLEAMIRNGDQTGVVAMHQIDDTFDGGELVKFSKPFRIVRIPVTGAVNIGQSIIATHADTANLSALLMSEHTCRYMKLVRKRPALRADSTKFAPTRHATRPLRPSRPQELIAQPA